MKGTASSHYLLIFLIITFSLSVIGYSWLALFRTLDQDKKKNIAAAVQRNDNLAIALEQYTIRTIQAADVKVHFAKSAYQQNEGVPSFLDYEREDRALTNSVSIADEQGKVIREANHGKPSRNIQVDQTDYFRYHSHHSNNELHISPTAVSNISGQPAVTFSRRVNKPDGSFKGVALIQIHPKEFTRFFATANLGSHDLFSLISPRFITYARRNGAKESWGEDISHSKLRSEIARRPVGNYYAIDVLHNLATYFSYRKVPGYPVIVTTGAAESEVLASYYQYRQAEINGGIVTTMLMLAFSVLTILILQIRRKSLVSLKESEERHRAIFEHSMDAILLTKPTGEVLRVNPAACTIFQMSEAEICASGRNLLADQSDPNLPLWVNEQNKTGFAKGEITFRRKDGTTFPGEVSTAIFLDARGEAFSTVIIRDVTENKKLQAQLLQQQTKSQRKITEEVINVQEQEREEIGRELHDNVNQVLTAAKLYLELGLTDQQSAADYIRRSISLVMNSINEIRNLSRNLAAPTLGTRSLTDSINALAELVQSSSGIAISFDPLFDEEILSKEQKLAVYRIVQEQLNNIVRHAKANEVFISLYQKEGVLQLAINDNGRGFDTNTKSNGIGLNNIINRARVLEGEVNIDTAPGQGCTLAVSIPLLVAQG